MKLNAAVAFILLWALDETTAGENGNLTVYEEPNVGSEQAVNVHSRRKRYIVFPKGSSLQLLLEVLSHVPTGFRVVVGPTLQVAWELPSERLETFRSKRSDNRGLCDHVTHLKPFSRCAVNSRERRLAGKKLQIFSDLATLMDYSFSSSSGLPVSLELVYCNTYLFRPVVDIFRLGTTVGLAWQLPDDPMIHFDFKKKHKMYKRSVYKKMEQFMRPGGSNGRQCLLKALCESGQRTPSKKDFLREILHKIFSVDSEEEGLDETEEDAAYRKAHRSVNQNCDTLYPDCQFSIFSAIQ